MLLGEWFQTCSIVHGVNLHDRNIDLQSSTVSLQQQSEQQLRIDILSIQHEP